jgi:hypothetical protein
VNNKQIKFNRIHKARIDLIGSLFIFCVIFVVLFHLLIFILNFEVFFYLLFYIS